MIQEDSEKYGAHDIVDKYSKMSFQGSITATQIILAKIMEYVKTSGP